MFSLIISTLGRVAELEALLASLVVQTDRNFEVIIVDQNSDGRLDPTISKFRGQLDLHRLHSAKGLSRARNLGLAVIKGDIVAFPDDDCTYPPTLLADVRKCFQMRRQADGIAFASRDRDGRLSGPRWATKAGPITRKEVWRQAVSYTVFLRRMVIEAIGGFDEQLGVGADSDWQAGEETDYLLRALDKGMRLHFDPSLHIIHPREAKRARSQNKAYDYGAGVGRVVKLHGYPLTFKIKLLCGPVARGLLYGATACIDQAGAEFAALSGRLKGLRSS